MRGDSRNFESVSFSVHPSEAGLIARALIRPAAWADASTVTIVSLSLGVRPIPLFCPPVSLRVGYNHAPASEGEVLAASQAGNVAALQAALDSGGSTEEASDVREIR